LLPAYAKDLVSDDSRDSFLEELSFEKLKSTNEDYSFTYEYMSDEGVLYYQARVSYVKKKDRTRAVVIGTRNIDDLIKKERLQKEQLRKAYIQAENASNAKTNFLNNMSHDIRTPMNVILGYNQLMKKKLSDPVLVDYQKKIEQSGNLLLSIINDVLNMARIESGKSVLAQSSESIVDMVEEVSNVFGAMAKEKEIVLDTKIDIKHKQVLCDSTKVKEILVNLIGNAIKYTPSGGHVTVDVKELECSKEGYGTYQVQIIDTGIGMSESFIPTLFDSFTREASVNIMGTGLGMAIVKKLIDMMGGTIDVESVLGKGSTFTITIDHKIVDDERDKTKQEDLVVSKHSLEGKHVLLTEDNELNAEFAKIILEDCGLHVDLARDGLECVDKVTQKPVGTYDFILMDIQMPNMNGYLATQKIRAIPEKQNIPIIAMSANAFDEDKKKALNVGMDGYISKPIDMDKVGKQIIKILKSKAGS
jgi:signal transduction histidine kinase/ActR/RegA family two-component response regulator